jgi:hypothetical protein
MTRPTHPNFKIFIFGWLEEFRLLEQTPVSHRVRGHDEEQVKRISPAGEEKMRPSTY